MTQTKLPLNEILLLAFKRVLGYSHQRNTNLKYTNKDFQNIIKNQVVVRSFCFGLILSPPLALIAKNGDFVSPFLNSLPFGKQYMSERLYQCGEMAEYRQRVDNTMEFEWKCRLCRRLHFPFNSMTKYKNTLENTLSIDIKEI